MTTVARHDSWVAGRVVRELVRFRADATVAY